MSMRILASRIAAGYRPRALGRGVAAGGGGVGDTNSGTETTAISHHRGELFAQCETPDHRTHGGAKRKLCGGAEGRGKRILFCGREFPMYIEFARERLNKGWELRSVDRSEVRETIVAWKPDVIVPLMCRIGAEEIGASRNLRLIHQNGAGLEGVDREAAKRAGVDVMNISAAETPNAAGCAEYTLWAALSLLRNPHKMETALVHERQLGYPLGASLGGKRVLILGFGAIGKECAWRFQVLGAAVSAFRKRHVPEETGSQMYAVKSLERDGIEGFVQMAKTADVLIACIPLTAETASIIDGKVLAAMPPGGFLVNVARGGIVDRDSIVSSIKSGHTAGFATDVFWREPFDSDDPDQGGVATLKRLRDEGHNIVMTPHVAGSTHSSVERMAEILTGNITRYFQGSGIT